MYAVYHEAHGCLKMPRQLVHCEELRKLIAQTSGAISMINESHYSQIDI
jgi:hypothetical protein